MSAMPTKPSLRAVGALAALAAMAGCAGNGRSSSSDVAPGRSISEAAQVNLQLAVEYMKLDNLPVAREKMERALKQDPQNATVQATAGVLFERLGDDKLAEKHYAAGARLGRNDPNVQNTYAGFLCRKGRIAEGEKMFLEVARHPLYQVPDVAYTNAGVCARNSPTGADRAEGYFQQALAIQPNSSEALLQLGDLVLEKGDAVQASALVRRYLGVNKPTPEVYWLGVRAERKAGDSMAAAGYARKLLSEFPDSQQAQMLRSGIPR